MALTYLTARATQANRDAQLYRMHSKKGKISLDRIIDEQVKSRHPDVRLFPFSLVGEGGMLSFGPNRFFRVIEHIVPEVWGVHYLDYELDLKALCELGLLKLYEMSEGTFFRINYDALDVDELTYFDFAATKTLELDHNQLFVHEYWCGDAPAGCKLDSVYEYLGKLYKKAQPAKKVLAFYKNLDKKGIRVIERPWNEAFKDAKFGGVATGWGLRLLTTYVRGKVVAEVKQFSVEIAFKGLKTVKKRFNVYEFWRDRDPLRVAGKEGWLVKALILEVEAQGKGGRVLKESETTFDAVIDLVEKVA